MSLYFEQNGNIFVCQMIEKTQQIDYFLFENGKKKVNGGIETIQFAKNNIAIEQSCDQSIHKSKATLKVYIQVKLERTRKAVFTLCLEIVLFSY